MKLAKASFAIMIWFRYHINYTSGNYTFERDERRSNMFFRHFVKVSFTWNFNIIFMSLQKEYANYSFSSANWRGWFPGCEMIS